MFAYVVTITLPGPERLPELLAWLEDDHLMDVVRAGAQRAEAIVLDAEDAPEVECRYLFASREAFAAYEAGPAEALRAEGRERFGPQTGIVMRRRTGERRIERG